MGYTAHDISLITKHLGGIKSVLDFGAQCNYSIPNQAVPPFIDSWYRAKGIQYDCIDLAGDNEALIWNWSYPLEHEGISYDAVIDCGSSEHSAAIDDRDYQTTSFYKGHINSVYPKVAPSKDQIEYGFYNCWLNKHNFCKTGGLIISVNPKTGNWPLHGYTYLTKDFYTELEKMADYEILELGETAASGNTVDGYNIYAVLRKVGDRFPSFEEFKTLPVSKS